MKQIWGPSNRNSGRCQVITRTNERTSQSPAPMLAAGACRCLRIMICSAVVLSAQPSSPIVPLFILRRSIMPCSHKQRRTCSAVAFASSVFGMSQLVLHEKSGLLEIFLSMCESSAPASGLASGRLFHHRRTPRLCVGFGGPAWWYCEAVSGWMCDSVRLLYLLTY